MRDRLAGAKPSQSFLVGEGSWSVDSTALLGHVDDVVELRAEKQVVRPDAVRNVAPMQHVHAVRNWTDEVGVRDSVSKDGLVSMRLASADPSIASSRQGRREQPARIGLVHLCHQAIDQRCRLWASRAASGRVSAKAAVTAWVATALSWPQWSALGAVRAQAQRLQAGVFGSTFSVGSLAAFGNRHRPLILDQEVMYRVAVKDHS